ncbi:hypothetical protein B0675_26295 [Streptomyces sp. M41(2017)]|nr:hypothetical protein B0675_26295 [Streptomyces sp. M41(2017)]
MQASDGGRRVTVGKRGVLGTVLDFRAGAEVTGLAVQGPLARSVRDAAALLDVIAGLMPDPFLVRPGPVHELLPTPLDTPCATAGAASPDRAARRPPNRLVPDITAAAPNHSLRPQLDHAPASPVRGRAEMRARASRAKIVSCSHGTARNASRLPSKTRDTRCSCFGP